MARSNWSSREALELTQALESAPYRYNFFQLLRTIDSLNPQLPRMGCAARPADEALRLGQQPSLSFAPSMLASFRPASEGRREYLAGYFFGLFGPNGPLPLHLTEYAQYREETEHDPTFRRFADVFHHRMMALFYRAWAESEPTVQADRPAEDRFSNYVGSMFGLGMDSLRGRDELRDEAKLFLAGRLSMQTRPVEGLQAILEELFRVPMQVVEYVGEWMELPIESRLILGDSPDTGTLGVSTTLGRRVWGGQHKFQVRCGPLSAEEFRRFLPGRGSLQRLAATVRNYVGDELDWEVRLICQARELPRVRLGASGRLGWTSWLGSRSEPDDADDVVLQAHNWRGSHRRAGAAENMHQ
jgi:type VI secretion system protein ImpH